MCIDTFFWLQVIGVFASCVAAVYAVAAAIAMRAGPRCPTLDHSRQPPVSIIKPLYGMERDLDTTLRSFCVQDYPAYQIVFSVAAADDDAVVVARRLQAEFDDPANDIDIDVVVDATLHGQNDKISNVINAAAEARHALLIVADSDIRVTPDYLGRIVAAVNAAPESLVTCAYRSRPGPSPWSRLGALFVNEWFLPSVLISQRLGYASFGFGSTLALTRDTLERAGGFESVANALADDYALADHVHRATGQPTVLSDYVAETIADEPSFSAMLGHETRWMRTISMLTPLSYFFLGFSFGLPAACAAIIFGFDTPAVWVLVALTVIARIDAHRTLSRQLGQPAWRDLWLLPARGGVNALIWVRGFGRRSVQWRGRRYAVDADGALGQKPRD